MGSLCHRRVYSSQENPPEHSQAFGARIPGLSWLGACPSCIIFNFRANPENGPFLERLMTLGESFAFILDRDLGRLADQIQGYVDEDALWRIGGTTKNSAGTLALHLVGNLEHFIGATLGGTGYVRDREAEFGDRNVPRAEMLARIAACRETMRRVLGGLSDEVVQAPWPGESPMGLGDESAHTFLLHLTGHFSWHLGQIDYHRRIVAPEGA